MNDIKYLIARPWDDDEDDDLCIYSFHNAEILTGTIEDAKESLEYARRQSDDEDAPKYKIYRVFLEELNDE